MSYFSRTFLYFSKRYILEFTKKKNSFLKFPKIAYFTQYFNSNSKRNVEKSKKKKNLILETG